MSSGVDGALEVWVLVFVNFLGFFLGTAITGISYIAYRFKNPRPSLRNATIGFGLLTLGTAIEPMYQLGVKGSHVLASGHNLRLQILEGAVISLGFLVLFFSIYRYSARSRRRTITLSGAPDDLLDDPD